MNEISLILDRVHTIKLELSEKLDAIFPFEDVTVKLFTKENSYTLSFDCLKEEIEVLHHRLNQAMENTLPLHESITKDIGYTWNEELQNTSGLFYITSAEGQKYWVGLHNLVWSTPGNCTPLLSTWLYNDKDGRIILEITPHYPWTFNKPKSGEAYVPYEQWAKQYKPLAVYVISSETAEQWKKQTAQILRQLNLNIDRL